MAPNAPAQQRPRIAPDPDPDSGDVTSSAEDRLYALLHDGQVRQERLLEGVREDIRALTVACSGMSGEIKVLQVTPGLLRMMTIGMIVVVVLVGTAAGAQVAVSLGTFSASTAPGEGE